MIEITRTDGRLMLLAAEQVESLEGLVGESIVTLVSGRQLHVTESVDELRARFVAYQQLIRARIVPEVVATEAEEGAGS